MLYLHRSELCALAYLSFLRARVLQKDSSRPRSIGGTFPEGPSALPTVGLKVRSCLLLHSCNVWALFFSFSRLHTSHVPQVRNVSCDYASGSVARASAQGPSLLSNVSFSVNNGEVLCVLGPKRSGKTALLNIIRCAPMQLGLLGVELCPRLSPCSGVDLPQSGYVVLQDQEIRNRKDVRR